MTGSENVMTNLLSGMKKEREFSERILQESLDGKRDFWIIKRLEQYSLYPAGHKIAEFIMHKDPDKYLKLGFLKVLKRDELKEVLTLRALLFEINAKYVDALKKAFKGGKDGRAKDDSCKCK
jgi:hypothetical protein